MVRRVRRARPDALPRARRWAGPPPLLLLATLAGFLVAPMVDEPADRAEPAARAVTVAHVDPSSPTAAPAAPDVASEPVRRPTPTVPAVPTAPTVRDRAARRPATLQVDLASMNLDRRLTPAQAADDARTLTRRAELDIVGWQEADRFGSELAALPGWDTRTFPFGRRSSQLAISWRRSEFALVAARQRQVPLEEAWREGRYPYGRRLVATVTLRHRDSGRLLTVVDAHLPQPLGDLDRSDRPDRWVAGTADYDLGGRADRPRRAGTGPAAYRLLGDAVLPAYRPQGRRVDFVYVDRDAHRAGRVRFAGRWVVDGFAGDHDALVTRLLLR